jgi:transposase-like protein
MKRQPVSGAKAQPRRKYSESFKRRVVNEYERGFLNKDRLAARHGIKGNDTILQWCRKYGKLPYPVRADAQTGRPMKDPQKQRIKELERALSDALLKIKAYEKLIELTEQQEGIVIKKKDGTPL